MARTATTKPADDLTHAEAGAAFRAFCSTVSSKAEIHVYLGLRRSTGGAIRAALSPRGLLDRWSIDAGGDTYTELLQAIEAAWADNSEAHAVKVVREMALAIIDITDSLGRCTDAALRAKFDAADVARYGEHATAAANEMASNGPFSIVTLAGANDAVAA